MIFALVDVVKKWYVFPPVNIPYNIFSSVQTNDLNKLSFLMYEVHPKSKFPSFITQERNELEQWNLACIFMHILGIYMQTFEYQCETVLE
jgi:hypothetical protein